MNRLSKNIVFRREVVAYQFDMQFLKINLETKFYTSLNVMVQYFLAEYISVFIFNVVFMPQIKGTLGSI